MFSILDVRVFRVIGKCLYSLVSFETLVENDFLIIKKLPNESVYAVKIKNDSMDIVFFFYISHVRESERFFFCI